MAIQFTDFSKIPAQAPDFSGFSDIFENVLKGYQIGKEPQKMREEEQKRQLANAMQKLLLEEEPQRFKTSQEGASLGNMLKKLQAEYYPQTQEANLALINAQRKKAERPDLTDLEKTVAGLDRIKTIYGENSPQFVLASAIAQKKGGQGLIGGDVPTKAFITQNQKLVQSVDNTLPMIDSLINEPGPGQLIGKYKHPDEQARYKAKTSTIIDSLVSALNLPKTNESLELASNLVKQGKVESRDAYIKRLSDLKRELQERKNRSLAVLNYTNTAPSPAGSTNQKRLKFNPSTGGFD